MKSPSGARSSSSPTSKGCSRAAIGFSLALACDLIIASESAYFLAAFKNVGIPPDGGAVFFLTQHLGIARAKEIAYTARKGPAREAKEMGLVMKVVLGK